MRKRTIAVFLLLGIIALGGLVSPDPGHAGVHQLTSWTDSSSDTSVPVTDHLMATITSNASQGGNDTTSATVSVGGTVDHNDVTNVCAYYGGTLEGCVNPSSTPMTGLSISLPGNTKGGSDWTFTVSLAGSAGGKTFNLTVTSVVGTDDAVLPDTTATRNATAGCSEAAPSVSITPTSREITTDGGTASYTVSITNNDTGAGCTDTTFNLSATDTDGGTNFVVPSTLTPGSVTLAPAGGNTSVTLEVTAQTGITSGSNDTFVTATEASHPDGTSNTVTTTINVSAGCTPATPSVSIAPASRTITTDGGTGSYTVTVLNNDSGGCADTTFNLNAVDSGDTGNFLTPSSLTPGSLTLAEGTSDTSTLTVTAQSGQTSGTLSTYVEATDAGHTTGTSNTVNTTISIGPVSGDGNILVRSPEEICHSCHKTDLNRTSSDSDWGEAIKTHNSDNLGSTKWAGQGGWGITGGKYGEFSCTTCHTAHFTTNIYLIDQTLTTPSGTWDSTGTTEVTVDFREIAGSTAPYPYAMGNDADDHTTSTRVCEVCHTITDYHRYDTTGQTNKTHNNGTDCIECHDHRNAFKGLGDCLGCHKDSKPKTLGTTGTIRQIVENAGDGGGDFVRLSRHVSDGSGNEIVTVFDCALCHREGNTTDASPVANVHNDGGGLVNLRNVDSRDTGWDIDNKAMTETMRNDMDNFCMACHDSGGAEDIAVIGDNTSPSFALPPNATQALSPFNDTDNFRNGRDGFTTRTRVLDVETQFYNGTGGTGSGYNGNYSQHAVRGARYSQPDPANNWTTAAWTNHVTRKGQTLNSATVRESATLHCSDCHLSETNAHGAQNSWHMLLDGTANNYTNDIAMTGLLVKDNLAVNVCYKCHNVAVYQGASPTAGVSRMDHSKDSDWYKTGDYGTGDEAALLGSPCLNCHAGWGFGYIHGVNVKYTAANKTMPPTGTNHSSYRFMPGAWLAWEPGTGGTDADWNSTTNGSCYFPASSSWSTCTSHSNGRRTGVGVNYARPTAY